MEHFEPYLNKLCEMENNLTELKNDHSMIVKTEVSIIDGKMVDILQGDSGALCHYCNIPRKIPMTQLFFYRRVSK